MKKEIQVTTVTPRIIRILKIATCPTLSESAVLTYHVGATSEGEIFFRVWKNTGAGYFSAEWISINTIKAASDKVPADKPITSFILNQLFIGRSANNPSFLFAVLKQEGFVQRSEIDIRCYDRIEPTGFMAEIDELMKSDVSLDQEGKPKKLPKKKVVEPPSTDASMPVAVE
jgi:hypothetical protein